MPFTISKTFDYGSANPILARLVLQTRDVLQSCNMAKDVEDRILGLCIKSLGPGLLRCWEIRDRFEAEFQRQVESYKNQIPNAQMIPESRVSCLSGSSKSFAPRSYLKRKLAKI